MMDDFVQDLSPLDGEMEDKDVTIVHQLSGTAHWCINVPGHEPRTTSATFRASRKELIENQKLGCWICGTKENLQLHHDKIEWSLFDCCDISKLRTEYKDFSNWDKVKDNDPSTYEYFLDSTYNGLVLCQPHHLGTGQDGKYGVHVVPKPIWLAQKFVKDGYQYIVPQQMTSKDFTSENLWQRVCRFFFPKSD